MTPPTEPHAQQTGTASDELRSLPDAELRQRLADRRAELAVLRVKARQSALEQPHRIRLLKREIAYMLTIANSRGRA